MLATKCEAYRWIPYGKLVGLTLSKDGANLPGMVTVDMDNFNKSLDNEIERLKTQYATYDSSSKNISFSEWFTPVDRNEIETAIKTTLSLP